MDLKNFKHRSTFTALANVVVPSEEDRFVAKASLEPLKGLLPPDVNPDADPDLLYISCNGAVGGLCNKNGDGISNATALAIYGSAKNKYINVEHERDKVVGVILYPGLTRYGTNEPLTAESAAALQEPFNMAFAGVLWKVISPMMSKYIVQQGGSIGQDALAMSWEIAFDSYDIGVGSRNIFDAKVVKAEDPTFSVYEKCLRQNGGKGTDASGKEVFRIINGDAIILGYSVVSNPAAEVKGILPVENAAKPVITVATVESFEEKMQRLARDHEIDLKDPVTLPDGEYRAIRYGYTVEIVGLTSLSCTKHDTKDGVRNTREGAGQPYLVEVKAGRVFYMMQDGKPLRWEAAAQKSEKNNITPSTVSVTLNTPQSMKIETLEQLQSNWAEIRKCETAASVADFVKAIKDGSDKYMADLKAQEELVQNAELAKAANEKRSAELKASLDEVKKELAEVRASQEALQTNQKFQERMASFDETFDLDDEDRAFITKDIKDLDDESFAAYSKKCEKMMAAKKKKAPPAKTDDNDDDADDAKAAKAAEDKAAEMKAALASVKEEADQKKLPNGVAVDEDVAQQMATAFGASMKIDGKTVAERKAARAAKK